MAEIHINRRNAVLVLRTRIPKSTYILNWYCSILGRVLTHKTVKVEDSVNRWGKRIASQKSVRGFVHLSPGLTTLKIIAATAPPTNSATQ